MRKNIPQFFFIITVLYLLLVFGFGLILNRGENSIARINLEHSEKYVRNGFLESHLLNPDFSDKSWFPLPYNKFNAKAAGFLNEYKKPFLHFFDDPNQFFTYAIVFNITDEQYDYYMNSGITPALFLPGIADNWEAYLNGSLIHSEFYLDEFGVIKTHRNLQMYPLPFSNHHLKAGTNLLVFRIASPPWFEDFGLYRDSGYFIDSYSNIQLANSDHFQIIILGISIFIAFFFLLIFIRNRSDIHYLYFTFFLIPFGIYTLTNTQLAYLIIKDTQLINIAEYSCVALCGIPFMLFVKKVANLKVYLAEKIVFGIAILTTLLIPFGGLQFRIDLCYIAEAYMLLFLLYSCQIAYRTIVKQVKQASGNYGYSWQDAILYVISNTLLGNIIIGLILTEIAILWGLFSIVFLKSEVNYILLIIFSLTICMSFALIDDITKTKLLIKNRNALLEDEVNARTADLIEQTKLAQSANETKTRFLATMSHEIRSPMNAVIGLTEIELMKVNLPAETKATLNKIRSSGYSLLSIINDILDLSKIETGKLRLVSAPYDTACMINDSVQLNVTRISSKPIEFVLHIDETLPAVLIGDELRIKQVLNNLLSNAIKYTKKGTVILSISHHVSNDIFYLIIKVMDTGQGMKPDDLNKCFNEYSRFNEEVNHQTEGTGLGLNITRHLVKSMQGDITVQSEYGKGSEFTATLTQVCPEEIIPIGKTVAQQLMNFSYTDEKVSLQIRRVLMPYGKILVVDDNRTNLFVANGLLSPYLLNVDTALSGYEAIEMAKLNVYDIIFMDHMMPGIDGIETTTQLRKQGYRAPIIALTANALVGNDALFKDKGFNDFISKPINLSQMDDILNKYVRGAHPNEKVEYESALDILPDKICFSEDLYRAFLSDAKKALRIMTEHGDLESFTITVHALKAALDNIGEHHLSLEAKRLENAGKNNNLLYINHKADDFVKQLNELIKQLENRLLDDVRNPIASEENFPLFSKQCALIRKAAGDYDTTTIEKALKVLESNDTSKKTNELITTIKDLMLYSNFEEIVELLAI